MKIEISFIIKKQTINNKKILTLADHSFNVVSILMKEFTSKINPRLKQIRIVSQIAKYISLGFLIWSIGFSFYSISPSLTQVSAIKFNEWRTLPAWLFTFVLWFWYWKLSRLFYFYERGLIFAADSIRCIKTLGLLWVIGWMLLIPMNYLLHPTSTVQSTPVASSGSTPSEKKPRVISVHYLGTFRMGFFSFNFGTNFDFGRLLEGATIILIAWIMEEGRKLQEEQELTV